MKNDSFGLRLAKARNKAGYSVAKAAEIVGTSYSRSEERRVGKEC